MRVDSSFNRVPKVFAPEKSYYDESIMISGLFGYVLGALIFVILILFMLFRYVFGFCGGTKSRFNKITRLTKHCTTAFIVIGGILWFSGSVTAMIGAVKFQ